MRAAMKIPFDTLAYTQTLRKSGMEEGQANAHADALVVAVSQGVATHEDIQEMRHELKDSLRELRQEFKEDIQALREEFKGGIQALRGELKEDIEALRINAHNTLWLISLVLVVVVATNPVAMHVMKVVGLIK